MLVAEAMMPSFGIIGVGGVAAFVIGSVFLLDTDFQPMRIALPLIAAIALVSVLILSVILGLIWRGRKRPVVSGTEAIIGAEVSALQDFVGEGRVLLEGESWEAWSREPLKRHQQAVVTAIDGLRLSVQPKHEEDKRNGNDIG